MAGLEGRRGRAPRMSSESRWAWPISYGAGKPYRPGIEFKGDGKSLDVLKKGLLISCVAFIDLMLV